MRIFLNFSIVSFILVFILSCKTSKIPKSYYITTKEDLMKIDSMYVEKIEEYAAEYLPDSLKKEKVKYIILHGESFRGRYIVINKKDTIDKFYKNKEELCIFSKYYKIPSDTKKVEIEDVGGRGVLKLKIPKKYDYIEITGPKNEWELVYLDYPEFRTCL